MSHLPENEPTLISRCRSGWAEARSYLPGILVSVIIAVAATFLSEHYGGPVMLFALLLGMAFYFLSQEGRCIAGIEPNRERCLEYVQNSIGLVTALNPVLGYEKSAAIAKEALKTGGGVYDLVIAKGWLTKEKLDELLKPENMTHPRLYR